MQQKNTVCPVSIIVILGDVSGAAEVPQRQPARTDGGVRHVYTQHGERDVTTGDEAEELTGDDVRTDRFRPPTVASRSG